MGLSKQLRRAELYGFDRDGNPIRKTDRHAIGYTVMPVRETKPHALSHANTLESEEASEQEWREREARAMWESLPAIARQALRLALERTTPRERTLPFPASQRAANEAAGWLFVRYDKKGRTAVMVKSFIGHLTHAEIGERLGITVDRVRRLLSSVSKDVYRFAELRGWA